MLEVEKKRAEEMQFQWEYKIYASDIRKEVVESAKRSASFAGLAWEIEFSCQDYQEALRKWISWYMVSNPPYGLRLDEDDANEIHSWLADMYTRSDILWGIISSDLEFEKKGKTQFKKRKLYNWGEMCYFYRKL